MREQDTIKIPEGYQQTKVGIIPDDWEVRKLGDICQSISSGRAKVRLEEGLYAIYGSTGIIGFCNDYAYSSVSLLIARVGAQAGLIKRVNGKYNVSDNALILMPKKIYYLDYAFYQLVYYNLNKITFGSGQPLLTSSQLKLIPLSLPPLPEQKAIADCLSTWDKAIEKKQALIEQKEFQKKGLMQQLLSGKQRLKGFEEEWNMYYLNEMFKERREVKNSDLTLLSIGERGVYPQSESNKKDTSNTDKSKYKRICKNDIGYNTMRMWQGRSALSNLEGIVSPAYTIVTPKSHANPLYFAYLFKTPKLMNLFWRNSQGLVNDTLNCKFKDFSLVKTDLPSFKEQTAIAEILSTADKETDLEKQQLQELKDQKKGLMQQLLTGKKRLNFEMQPVH